MKRCTVCDRPLSATRARKQDRCGQHGEHLHVGDFSHPLYSAPFVGRRYSPDLDGRAAEGLRLLAAALPNLDR